VVAEFEDESVYHFWLQPGKAWAAETAYQIGDLVAPSTPNGFMDRATRFGDPYPPWQPDEPRADGLGYNYADQSFVEPTTANGFYYACIETKGPNPRSGTTEPTWPTFKGGTVFERVDTGQPESTAIDSSPPPSAGSGDNASEPDPDPFDRYGLTSGDFSSDGGRGTEYVP
jgi:hypothetical protein